MKAFKKCVLILAAVLIAVSFTGCFGGGQTVELPELALPSAETSGTASGVASGESSSVAEPVVLVEQDDCEDTIEGLCKYLEGNYAVAGDKIEMSYDVIGAKAGYKYSFTYNKKTVYVEVYEFDLKNLNKDGEQTLSEIKEDETFTVLDKEVSGVLSGNGKYIMIYTDTSEEQANVEQKDHVLKLFKEFKV